MVRAADADIDELFLVLEQRAYALIAQQAPVAVDLRFMVSSLRVMADYERVGSLAVALAKVALADWPREPETVELIRQMSEGAVGLLADARQAWRDQDRELASRLQARDDVTDEAYRRLTAHLLRPDDGPRPGQLVAYGLLAGRHLERVADHAVAVGSRVRYMLTGDPDSLAVEVR